MLNSEKSEVFFKWLFIFSLAVFLISYQYKDKIPAPDYYDIKTLTPPIQTPTDKQAFTIRVNGQQYEIRPKFDYQLNGVIVSYSDADGFGNIWHHRRWQDFINLRDLCVIWGKNVQSGVYKKIEFSSDSWTCWAQWPDRQTGSQFKMNAMSNNHLLTDNLLIKQKLMQARPGDQIRLKGVLAEYSNQNTQYRRGTSTTRDDTGNGACETIYLSQFEILKPANPIIRYINNQAAWCAGLSLVAWILLIFIAPHRKYESILEQDDLTP